MSAIKLEQIEGNDADLKAALTDAHLPTDDIDDQGRTFFRAQSSDGRAVGFLGVERCGDNFLLRSVVVLPDQRGARIRQRFGRAGGGRSRSCRRRLPCHDEFSTVLHAYRIF